MDHMINVLNFKIITNIFLIINLLRSTECHNIINFLSLVCLPRKQVTKLENHENKPYDAWCS